MGGSVVQSGGEGGGTDEAGSDVGEAQGKAGLSLSSSPRSSSSSSDSGHPDPPADAGEGFFSVERFGKSAKFCGYQKAGGSAGYEMVCMVSGHNLRGQLLCTKSLAGSRCNGCADAARRILKLLAINAADEQTCRNLKGKGDYKAIGKQLWRKHRGDWASVPSHGELGAGVGRRQTS